MATKNITQDYFRRNYFHTPGPDFVWQNTPLQVYPLELVADMLVVPSPLLRSDYFFLVHLSKGGFIQQVGREIVQVKDRTILFVPEGETFSIKSIEPKPEGFFVLIDRKVVNAVLNATDFSDLVTADSVISLDAPEDAWFGTLAQLLYEEVSGEKPNRKISNGLLQALLHKIINLGCGKRSLSRQDEIATQFRQMVNEHYAEQRSVRFYAEKLSISDNYLNRCVRNHYGKSCKQLILSRIILQSQIMMFETTKNISEISLELGFEDSAYFSRIYKKISGESPSEFKQRVLHGLS